MQDQGLVIGAVRHCRRQGGVGFVGSCAGEDQLRPQRFGVVDEGIRSDFHS
jgi:hypothetical protein